MYPKRSGLISVQYQVPKLMSWGILFSWQIYIFKASVNGFFFIYI
jgi:hypothetical protein